MGSQERRDKAHKDGGNEDGGGQGCVCAYCVIKKWTDKRRSGERETHTLDRRINGRLEGG